MGIVKILDRMHKNLRIASHALSCSINAQAEHWIRIGILAEPNPVLDHKDICQLLIRVEQAGSSDLQKVLALYTSALTSSTVSNTNHNIQEAIR